MSKPVANPGAPLDAANVSPRLQKLLNRLLRRLNLRLVRRSTHAETKQSVQALCALTTHWRMRAAPVTGWDASGLVFSRDRPLQLEALLRSYHHHCQPAPPLAVLWHATDAAYAAAYAQVRECFAGTAVSWHRQQDFAADTRALIAGARSHGFFFLVDDMVFIRPVDFGVLARFALERHNPALRLGRNVRWSHYSDSPRPPPPLRDAGHGLLQWEFGQSLGEWRPLSFDGDLFVREELAAMADAVEFHSPNSFEVALRVFLPAFEARAGLCFEHSRVVNIPLNRVQQEFLSRAGNVTPAELLARWQAGERLHVEALYGIATQGMHEDVGVGFIRRG